MMKYNADLKILLKKYFIIYTWQELQLLYLISDVVYWYVGRTEYPK